MVRVLELSRQETCSYENETKVVRNAVKEVRSHGESSDSEEQKEIDARRSNMIIYRVQETDSEVVDDRKSGDALLCTNCVMTY